MFQFVFLKAAEEEEEAMYETMLEQAPQGKYLNFRAKNQSEKFLNFSILGSNNFFAL